MLVRLFLVQQSNLLDEIFVFGLQSLQPLDLKPLSTSGPYRVLREDVDSEKFETHMSILSILLSFLLWGLIHSIFASLSFKSSLADLLGKSLMRGYRLFYNIFSAISFLPILWLVATLPDAPLYTIPAPWSYPMLLGQGIGLVLLIVGVLQTDTLSFVGLRQLFEEEKSTSLVMVGLYRLVRHPLYTAGLLVLWLSPQVTVNSFTMYVGATIYILVGAFFEERKLLCEFGDSYKEYKSHTPMLIPWLKF